MAAADAEVNNHGSTQLHLHGDAAAAELAPSQHAFPAIGSQDPSTGHQDQPLGATVRAGTLHQVRPCKDSSCFVPINEQLNNPEQGKKGLLPASYYCNYTESRWPTPKENIEFISLFQWGPV